MKNVKPVRVSVQSMQVVRKAIWRHPDMFLSEPASPDMNLGTADDSYLLCWHRQVALKRAGLSTRVEKPGVGLRKGEAKGREEGGTVEDLRGTWEEGEGGQ